MGVRIDCLNKRYGQAQVIEYVGMNKTHNCLWLCKCDCGNTFVTTATHLRSGHTKSCGCLRDEKTAIRFTKHDLSNSRLSSIWRNMKGRCTNLKTKEYHRYGGRGIKVCSQWNDDFKSFYDWAMRNGYSDNLSLDRIDNDKDYAPDNCRWADRKMQCRNKSNNRHFLLNGQQKTLVEWCEIYGMKYSTVYRRLRRDWSLKKALVTPIESNKIAFKWR